MTDSDAESVLDFPDIATLTSPVACSRCKCNSNRVAFLKKDAIVRVVCEGCLKRRTKR